MSFGDREPKYVRGELIEKPMPDPFHGVIQATLVWLLMNALRARGFRVTVETRSKLAADNYRLPDVAVFAPGQPFEQVPSEPPLIALEVVSEDERYSLLLLKLKEYSNWGVPHIWDRGSLAAATLGIHGRGPGRCGCVQAAGAGR
jgi:Uma2 family endonuclease